MRCSVAFTFMLTSLVCNCSPVADALNDVIVRTRYGRLRGSRITRNFNIGSDVVSTTFDRFLGVPYAKAPVGIRRFEAPEPPDPVADDVIRDALRHGHSCPQMTFSPDVRLLDQSEDCLFLDIYSPYEMFNPKVRYPVMVYVHGGSYEVGAGQTIDGSVLCQFGVVVVSINYRLGALGFLASGRETLSGNYGMLDQIESLRWVQENIQYFRGDPKRVTVFGHSVGAASVGLLMIIPSAEGLFHRVIAQSGVATAPYSVHDGSSGVNFTDYVRDVGRLFECRKVDLKSIVTCLRKVDAKEFINKRGQFPLYDPINPEFRPFVDGRFLQDAPKTLFSSGKFKHVPFIIGTVRDEFCNYFSGGERYRTEFDEALDSYVKNLLGNDPSLFEVVKFQYNDWANRSSLYEYQRGDVLSDMHMIAPTAEMADMIATYSDEIYEYHFSTPGVSFHSVELNYVFGAPFSGLFADEMTINGSVDQFSEAERQLSRDVMKMWTNFAKTGKPSTDRIKWSAYTRTDRRYLLLTAAGPHVAGHLRANNVAFWNHLLPSLLELKSMAAAATQLDDSVPWYTVTLIILVIVLMICICLLVSLFARRSVVSRRRRNGGVGGGGNGGGSSGTGPYTNSTAGLGSNYRH